MGRRVKGREATRLFQSIVPRIYWAVELGVPVFQPNERLYGRLYRLKLVPPGDVRPAFTRDIRLLYSIVERDYGRGFADRLFGSEPFILLNKVQGVDAADEVVVSGYSVGVREYDILERRWFFKPMYYGVKLVVDEELAPHLIVSRGIRRDDLLYPGDYTGELPRGTRWVPLGVKGRPLYGLGKLDGEGRVRVVRVWKLPGKLDFNPMKRDLWDAVKVNTDHLVSLEEEAVGFLKGIRDYGTVIINVSGGKDSTASAQLAVLAGYNRALFLDTGLDFPETLETVEDVVNKLGLDMIRIDAGDTFWRTLDTYGPPGRDYRWCCKVVKFSFLARVLKRRFNRIVSIVGQRRYESTSRALAGRFAPSGSTAYDYVATPIQEWTSLEVYLYLVYRRLPVNPLYSMGYERIGCYLCPTSRLAEIDAIRETHHVLWSRWIGYLQGYARSHGLPREWVDYGLWRWRFSYPGEIRVLVRRLGLRTRDLLLKTLSRAVSLSIEPDLFYGECYVFYLANVVSIDLDRYLRYLRITGLEGVRKGDYVEVTSRYGRARVHGNGRLEICVSDRRWLVKLVRDIAPMIYMVGKCIGCNLCEAVCPRGAINALDIEPGKCDGCRKCIHVCPSASSFTKHIIRLIELYST